MQLHLGLNEKTKLLPGHFQTWLQTFEATVNAHFGGENSEKAKTRALSIATVMQAKLSQMAR